MKTINLAKLILLSLLLPTICFGGLASYWKLEGNSNDYVGSNNGTDTSVNYVGGFRGQCVTTSAGTSNINFGNSATLGLATGDSFTVGGCFYKDTWANTDLFARNDNYTPDPSVTWELGIYNDRICYARFAWDSGGNDQIYCLTGVDMDDGKWTCIGAAGTVGTGSTIKVWKNGTSYPGTWVYGDGNAPLSARTVSARLNDKTYISAGPQSYKSDELYFEKRIYTNAEIKTKYQNLRGDF